MSKEVYGVCFLWLPSNAVGRNVEKELQAIFTKNKGFTEQAGPDPGITLEFLFYASSKSNAQKIVEDEANNLQ